MLTYPGDPRGNPPQHAALSSLSTSAAPFTGARPHPAGPTFPNPSFAVPAAPSLNAAGEWGDPSLMEAPARFMAPGAAAAASLGYTGEVFDSAPYGIYSEYHFGNFVDPHPLRSENSELISEKRPGTCGESSEALSNGFGLSSHCQQQNAFASKLLDGIGAESVGCYYPRPVPNQDPSGSATSLISGAPAVPVKSLTSEGVLGNISSQAAEAEKTANTQTLTEEGQEHSHCHPDAERNMLQMSDSSSRNRAIFLELMHNLSVVLLSTCNGGSSLHEYEKENLKSIIRNLKAVSSKGGKATLKGDDCLRNSSQMSCLRNNLSVAIPEHSVSTNTDSEFNAYFSQAFPELPEDKILDDSEVSQVSIYKKLWIEAEASVCKLKYELQVARMKLAAKKGHNTETVPIDPPEGDKAPRLPVSGGKPYSHAEASSACPGPAPLPPPSDILSPRSIIATKKSIVNEVDDTVDEMFARLKVLESRLDTLSSLGENKYEEQQRESDGSYAVDDAVLARLRILKSHADNITYLGLESSKQQRDAGTNMSGEIDDAGAEVCTRLEVLERNLSSLGDNKCEEQQKESKASSSVGDRVLARLQILKSLADNILSLGLESSKQQLNASTDIADEVDDAVMARLRVLKSCPDLEASSIAGNVEGVEEHPCTVGLQVPSRQPPPSPAAVLEKTTLPSASEPLEITGETAAIPTLPSIEVPLLSTHKGAPSQLEKDHSGLADDALPPAPLLSVPQEVGGLAQKIAKVKRLPRFRLPSNIKIKRPISEQGARAILLRKLGMVKGDEVDEQAINRCLEASFPKGLLQAILCGKDMVKGTPGELWGISASDVVF
ncbi:hypothetical protein ACQ4PT_069642 [Festuca glaucescens]